MLEYNKKCVAFKIVFVSLCFDCNSVKQFNNFDINQFIQLSQWWKSIASDRGASPYEKSFWQHTGNTLATDWQYTDNRLGT